jgi:hypothetical protein
LEAEEALPLKAQLRQIAEIQRLDAIRIYALERKLQALEERLDQLLQRQGRLGIYTPLRERLARARKKRAVCTWRTLNK